MTAPIGWPVWFRIYPGYHSGALLAGSAVLVALRSRAWRGWAAAGVLAGAAIYAQPMHAVGAVVVGVLVVQSPRAERMRAALAAAVGALVGLAPLLLWNLRNGMDTLSDGAAPSLHPEWSYLDRLRNTMSITARVAWGDPGNRAAVPDWVLVVQVVAIVGSAVLVVAGAVVLVRSARTSAPLLVALLLMLFGLSVLGSFSLDVDQRYAVAWWPALVVLVAAGAVGLQQLEYRSLRLVGSALIVVTVAANVVAVGGLAGTAFRERSQWPSATASTRDLAGDLERCDVAAVLGDYWAVYPALWGSDSEFSAQVLSGPTRTGGLRARRLVPGGTSRDPVRGRGSGQRCDGAGGRERERQVSGELASADASGDGHAGAGRGRRGSAGAVHVGRRSGPSRVSAPVVEPERRVRLNAGDRPGIVALVVLVVVFVAGIWTHRWISDDGFINFRIVDNLLDGHGPVFNPGERVEAGTSQLWLAVLTLAELLLGRWIELEWLAVVIGVVLSSAALVVAWLGHRVAWGVPVLPVGLLAWVPLAVVWDFATSGLELPLLWLWQAGCVGLLLVRSHDGEAEPYSPWWIPVLLGLGPLIRPDAAVYTICFGVAWLMLCRWSWRGALRTAALALAVPLVYQAFRMAFFGALVPNTALAKEAGEAVWGRGSRYLGDMVGTYTLWLPAVALVAIGVVLLVGSVDRRMRIVWIAAAAGALVHAVWVVRIGGDFMHARLLLADWFLLVLPVAAVPSSRLRLPVVLAASLVLLAWGGWAITEARAPLQAPGAPGVYDERSVYLAAAGRPHPVTLEDHSANDFVRWGIDARARAEAGEDIILWPSWGRPTRTMVSGGGVQLVWPNIGMMGYAAGPEVHVVDAYGLADPIAARLSADERGRAGHSKLMSDAWIEGRWAGVGVPLSEPAAAAERVLSCPPLQELLDATSNPVTPKLLVANVLRSVELTRLRIADDPLRAERELC